VSSIRLVGRLHDWNDARGFGFVTPNGGGERAFVHIGAFESRARRPSDGDLLSYVTTTDARGRRNAAAVRFAVASASAARDAGADARRHRPFRATGFALVFALALLALAVAGWVRWVGPAGYALMSAVTYLAYFADKSAAMRRRRRIPENMLHLMAVLGGWPGAAYAQQHFEHKRSKAAFVSTYRTSIAINLIILAAGIAVHLHPEWRP
jgi:uncharacterized membrane protein YsdA (DUF1294 family)/cold shock CspA family protein